MKAVVVDDIAKFRDNLIQDLNDYCPEVEIVGTADGVVSAAKEIKSKKPDVVFLDIQINQGTAFDLLEILGKVDFKIIFTTASDEYAIKAFKLSAVDYLLKPIDIDELKTAVNKVNIDLKDDYELLKSNINEENKSHKRLALHSQDKIEIVEIGNIIRCESNVNYTQFFFTNGSKMLVTKTLKEFDKMLSEFGFYRVHQSHLVNIDHLKEYIKIDGGYLKMQDGASVPISTRKRSAVLSLLKGVV
ncbi:MAG: DNA-binding response regulator [Flavobacteriales bacterium]|nr:DNA-binding response regulator [Flavobacteriales bacterium]|tara:strand:- start:30160 stop:30894 length:735 start_codon:yes stop_codon:yes gene_type:complete